MPAFIIDALRDDDFLRDKWARTFIARDVHDDTPRRALPPRLQRCCWRADCRRTRVSGAGTTGREALRFSACHRPPAPSRSTATFREIFRHSRAAMPPTVEITCFFMPHYDYFIMMRALRRTRLIAIYG